MSSKYLYDEAGDRLFQQIMELQEYYLTDCEYEIFTLYKQEMLDHFTGACDHFHLIEFGAGDAFKTRILIAHFLDNNTRFEYNPIDISENVILNLEKDLGKEFPDLQLAPINLEYFGAVEEISRKQQEIRIGAILMRVTFEEAEPIFMEISQKYSLEDIREFANRAGFLQTANFLDRRKYFVNSLWEKNE